MVYIKIKSWDELQDQYGLDSDGRIKNPSGKRALSREIYESMFDANLIAEVNSINTDIDHEYCSMEGRYIAQDFVIGAGIDYNKLNTTYWATEFYRSFVYEDDFIVRSHDGAVFIFEEMSPSRIKFICAETDEELTINTLEEFEEYCVHEEDLYEECLLKFQEQQAERAKQIGAKTNTSKTDNNTTTKEKGKTMEKIKKTATGLIGQNKENAIMVARVTAGKALNKKIIKLVKPKVPALLRGYMDSGLAPVITANAIAFAIKQYTDNPKAVMAADMMLEGAAFQMAESFNIDDMIEDLLDGVSLPGISSGTNLDDMKITELRTFAEENNIDITGGKDKAGIRDIIKLALEAK